MRRVLFATLTLAGSIWLAGIQSAYGWAEGDVTFPGDSLDCPACHQAELFFPDRAGPHGGYLTTTKKCKACHSVHEAGGGGYSLLPKQTTKDNCLVCHDGTGGYGVYGALASKGATVGATHRIDTTNSVPGGSVTGGSAVVTFTGESGYLSCEDCHSVHGADTVDPFNGERIRFHVSDLGWIASWPTDHLLRKQPIGSDRSTTSYGSDWCVGCHRGRRSGLPALMNHPVDSTDTVASPFYYENIAAVTTETSFLTTMTTLGLQGEVPTMTWSNRGFVMPTPRTVEQSGHSPICQQCHEDSRVVGSPGSVTPAVVTGGDDWWSSTDNPRFRNFPHETENEYMLVETYDNLCTNCHDVAVLP